MFDDQSIQNGPGLPPPNLPLGEPEDILARIDDREEESGGEETAELKTALGVGVLKPKQPSKTASPIISTPPAPQYKIMPEDVRETDNPAVSETYEVKGPIISKVLMVIVVILVILGVIWGGWWAYQKFGGQVIEGQNKPVDQLNNINETTTTVPELGTNDESAQVVLPVAVDSGVSSSTETVSNSNDSQVLFGETVDTDGDGLDDATEVKLGTDPKNWDTDGDGLSDGDEVNVWKTDPLKTDTDGDGYADGVEVKSGYNPLGAGKLFQPPTSTTSTI